MIGLRIDSSDISQTADWLDHLAQTLNLVMTDQVREAGARVQRRAEAITRATDAIGATRQYLEGFRVTMEGERTDQVTGSLQNVAPHAWFVEEGRNPGRWPPPGVLLPWMRAKGIPEELEFVIRRSIGQLGTIRRAGAFGQRAGLHITERALADQQEQVLQLLEAAWELALARSLL